MSGGPPQHFTCRKNQRLALGAGALALLAGAVGPWASVLGAINVGPTASAEVSILVFGGIAVLVLCAALDKGVRRASMVVGGLALVEAVWAIVHIQKIKADAGDWGALIQPGWGLYLTAIVGIALIASTYVVKPEVKLKPATA